MTQTTFRLIRSTLDAYFARLPNRARRRLVGEVREAIPRLSAHYTELHDPSGPELDYSDEAARLGYVYVYLGAHADYVRQILSRLQRHIEPLPAKLRVTAFGGGPGTDLVGLLRYLDDERFSAAAEGKSYGVEQVRAFIWDCERNWFPTWRAIERCAETSVGLIVSFQRVDLTARGTWRLLRNAFGSDLFFMSYCASELARLGDSADKFWIDLHSRARQGSKLLIVDNSSNIFMEYVERQTTERGWRLLHGDQGQFRLSDDEQTDVTHSAYGDPSVFDRRPRIIGSIAFRLYKHA